EHRTKLRPRLGRKRNRGAGDPILLQQRRAPLASIKKERVRDFRPDPLSVENSLKRPSLSYIWLQGMHVQRIRQGSLRLLGKVLQASMFRFAEPPLDSTSGAEEADANRGF